MKCISRSSAYLLLAFVCFLITAQRSHAEDWPQWRGPGRDGVWKETGIIDKFRSDRIKLRWSVPIGGGYSGPTVVGDRLYVMDRQIKPKEVERILCFDRNTGKMIWEYAYDCVYKFGYKAGPRGSVAIDDDRAYALGAMGHLHCLDITNGKEIWKKDLKAEYNAKIPTWGVSTSPLVDGDWVIVQIGGANGACVASFDKKSGKERWKALRDRPSYSSPIIIKQAGSRVLVCWTAKRVAGLDPASGRIIWSHPFGGAPFIATPVVNGDLLFISSFYKGSLMLKLNTDEPRVEEVWRRKGKNERNTDSLHSLISTPCLQGDHIYGFDSYGEFRCLVARTGDRVWEDQTVVPKGRWKMAHIISNGERAWLFSDLGELIITRLSPDGFKEISRAKLISPTAIAGGRKVCWAHPAFAYRHIFVRNDRVLVSASLAAEGTGK